MLVRNDFHRKSPTGPNEFYLLQAVLPYPFALKHYQMLSTTLLTWNYRYLHAPSKFNEAGTTIPALCQHTHLPNGLTQLSAEQFSKYSGGTSLGDLAPLVSTGCITLLAVEESMRQVECL